MKRFRTLISFLFIIMLAGCDTTAIRTPLDEIPDNYSIEDAKMEICLIIEDYDITYGEELLTDFMNNVRKNETASIRIVTSYPNEERLYVSDLTYDKGKYTYDMNIDDSTYPKTYSCMVIGKDSSSLADTLYILVNDEDVTYHDIMQGMLSSQSNALIEHDIVIYDKN